MPPRPFASSTSGTATNERRLQAATGEKLEEKRTRQRRPSNPPSSSSPHSNQRGQPWAEDVGFAGMRRAVAGGYRQLTGLHLHVRHRDWPELSATLPHFLSQDPAQSLACPRSSALAFTLVINPGSPCVLGRDLTPCLHHLRCLSLHRPVQLTPNAAST